MLTVHCYYISMQKNICAFSTASDNYVQYALVSLLGIRKQNHSIPLYIISSYLSEQSKQLLSRYGVQYIELDLADYFSKAWDYPIECYYLFAGPQALLKEGFTHSLYIDGDIFCASDPIKDIDLEHLSHFGGVAYEPVRSIFGSDYEKILNTWKNIANDDFSRIQTGVIYFNNKSMSKIDFLDKISKLYKQSIKDGIPRKGDDSLFALFQLVYQDSTYHHLPLDFNFIPTRNIEGKKGAASKLNEVVFFHFTSEYPKPWNIQYDKEYKPFSVFSKKWRKLTRTLTLKDRKKYFNEITGHAIPQLAARRLKRYLKLS